MRTVKAASLVLDFDLYPRRNLDTGNIARMVDALQAGTELPPVITDRKSKRVVDGFHRVRTVLKLDKEGTITIIEKTYRNEAAIFEDAVKYNAVHGAALDPNDRVRCLLIAEHLHIPLDRMAGALHMPVDKLSNLRNDRTARTSGGLEVALKRTIRHKAGQRLTKEQVRVNDGLSGMNQAFYVNQIISLIESDLLNKNDESLLERLRHLHGLLEGLLVD